MTEAILDPAKLLTSGVMMLTGAVGVMALGVIFIAIAGKMRETELTALSGNETAAEKASTPFMVGLTSP